MKKLLRMVLVLAVIAMSCVAFAEEAENTLALNNGFLGKRDKLQIIGSYYVEEEFSSCGFTVTNLKNSQVLDSKTFKNDANNHQLPLEKINQSLSNMRYSSYGKMQIDLYITGNQGERRVFSDTYYHLGEDIERNDGRNNISVKNNSNSATITRIESEISKEAWLQIKWFYPLEDASVVYYANDKSVLRKDTLNSGFFTDLFHIPENTRYMEITSKNYLNIHHYQYTDKEPSYFMQNWQTMEGPLDILFVSTHQDDEFLWFGGAIPWYASQGYNVGVIYLANGGVNRYHEALNALWLAGVKNHPIFLGYVNELPKTIEQAAKNWSYHGNMVDDLTQCILSLKPSVVVMQDLNGEYGQYQHILGVQYLQQAILNAMDETVQKEPWQVKKLYCHLYETNPILIDWEEKIMPGWNGANALQVATACYECNVSQLDYYSMENDGVLYDNRKFGLMFSYVGDDVLKNDFMENIVPVQKNAQ